MVFAKMPSAVLPIALVLVLALSACDRKQAIPVPSVDAAKAQKDRVASEAAKSRVDEPAPR